MSEIINEVSAVVREVCSPTVVDLQDPSRSLLEQGLDSLDLASVQMALEEKYDMEFPGDGEQPITIEALARLIAQAKQ